MKYFRNHMNPTCNKHLEKNVPSLVASGEGQLQPGPLPLNGFEKVTIINSVLIPRWTYRGLFVGNRQRMGNWDDILLEYPRSTQGIEQ